MFNAVWLFYLQRLLIFEQFTSKLESQHLKTYVLK